jgi:lipopolysaccharide transport system permease protein
VTAIRLANQVLGPIAFVLSPWRSLRAGRDAVSLLWKYRALCLELVRRDLTGQYAGQALGSFWVIGHTVSLLLIYAFVFVVVFKVKLELDVPRDYTSYLFAGLIPWLAISQALVRSCTALIGQSNLVKQVVFPLEVLPFSAIFIALTPFLVGTMVLLAYQLWMGLGIPWTVGLVPLVLILMVLFLSGLAFLFAAITPFFRDIKDLIIVFTVAGVYLVPAFYLPKWAPAMFSPIIYGNPFSYPIWVCQDIFYYGRIEHPSAWIIFVALAVIFFCLGFRAFRSLKPYVASVL